MGSGPRRLHAAALVHGDVDDDRALLHRLQVLAPDQVGRLGTGNQDGADDEVALLDHGLDVLLGGVEGGQLAAEDIVEVGEAIRIDVEDGHRGAEAHCHLGGVGADDSSAQYGDLPSRDAWHAAQEDAASAEGLLEILRPLLHREAAGDLAHGLQAGQGAVGHPYGLVGDSLDLAGDEGLGLLAVRGEVKVGEEDLPLAQKAVLVALRLLDLDDHVAGVEDPFPVGFDARAGRGIFGVLEACVGPGSRLDSHLVAMVHVGFYAMRGHADAIFVPFDLLDASDLHTCTLRLQELIVYE